MMGHGLCIWRGSEESRAGRVLVAFVAGFAWCQGQADPVVLFATDRWPVDATEHTALCRAVEDFLRARRLHGEVAAGYFALANA